MKVAKENVRSTMHFQDSLSTGMIKVFLARSDIGAVAVQNNLIDALSAGIKTKPDEAYAKNVPKAMHVQVEVRRINVT
jgi:hypothetical protein